VRADPNQLAAAVYDGALPESVSRSGRNPAWRRNSAARGERELVKLGRYEVVRELGKGAMGIVYLAKDPLIGRLVALKTIRAAAHADDDETQEFKQRFVREAQAAGILNHPSIVTVFDIGQDPETDTSFIAMEYVEGQNLKDALAQGANLTFDQIGDIISQVADGLDFAHTKGIVHRDVKPANIILLDSNRAKITDFGIAKIASGAANLTSTGQFLGTPNYMAPEQIKGIAVDGRTDLFSLGIVLYECLTRRKPFGGDSLTTISYRIVHEPFPPLFEINPRIPDGFEEIVSRCLAKDPGKRYQRGKDVANAIRAVLRGEAHPPDPMLAEETVFTRDADKIPTVEVPFPTEDEQPYATAVRTPPQVRTNPSPGTPRAAAPKPRPASPLSSSPLFVTLKRRIPAPLFIGVCVVLIALVLAAVVAIQAKKVDTRPVDRKAEALHARQRKLRIEGDQLLKSGNVDGAYEKFRELSRIAPGSPYVNETLQKLGFIRLEQLTQKQRVAQAKEKYDQAVVLYGQRQYAQALPLLEEAVQLNPASAEAASYLAMAREQQSLAEQQRRVRSTSRSPQTSSASPMGNGALPVGTSTFNDPSRIAAAAPVTLVVAFDSPVNDGYIQVKAGGQVIAHENLWEEKGRAIFRRKVGRTINITGSLKPGLSDIEVWVVIPTMSITEHHVVHQPLQAGSTHKLVVTFDKNTKRFDYTFS
jgi:serine/threonine protein kinase